MLSSSIKKRLKTETLLSGQWVEKSREIKERVIREWLQGIKREKIAENNDLADGSITNIVKDASLQEEYHNMELFRHLAFIL